MSFFSKIMDKKGEIFDLVRDPRLRDLIMRREFRLSEEYLHQEVFSKLVDDELTELKLEIRDGSAEISGKLKKRILPFAIPFSARFSIHSVTFSQKKRMVNLKLEELKPIDMDSLTKKLVSNVPFLAYDQGVVSVDLTRVPRLAEMFEYEVKGLRPFDFVVLKDLSLCPGEVVGKVGVIL